MRAGDRGGSTKPFPHLRISAGLALLLLTTATLLVPARGTNASAADQTGHTGRGPGLFAPLTPPASIYTVRAGDTLFAIAAKLGISDDRVSDWVSQVVKLNGMSSADALIAGQQLQLPDPGAGAATTSGSTAANTSGGSATSAFSANAGSVGYTVQPGDTLSSIGANWAVSADRISDWMNVVLKLNGLQSADALQVGQMVRLPALIAGATSPAATSSSGSGAATPAAAVKVSDVKQSVRTTSYTVQPGDSLSAIASISGVSDDAVAAWVQQVVQLNTLASADALVAGAVLQIPATTNTTSASASTTTASSSTEAASTSASKPETTRSYAYTVKSGDTLYGIADSQGVASNKLAGWVDSVLALNSMSSADTLSVGQSLLLPGTPPQPQAVPVTAAAVPSSGSDQTAPSLSNDAPATSKTQSPSYDSSAGPTTMAAIAALSSLAAGGPPARSSNLPFVAGPVVSPAAAAPTAPSGLGDSDTIKSSTTAARPNSSVVASGSSCYYTVQSGDTWDSLARTMSVPAANQKAWISAVAAINGIDATYLPAGDGLRMPC